ncbi:RNA polymerase sigma factor SigF [Oscillatoria sp. CS-180]|uniref:RNA polymerase sigma factor SigF n=1 Tax=Oscillatoria sp. CS-180 TaxID=3021720 RepID=UPI00232F0DC5|nr:RNA polymerase sigma factor SigF [Oscillatoria sp. CS-180]MDB9525902.1 RNA polymerase sigma factor SigF [Oscillatoria sp. CS-180]
MPRQTYSELKGETAELLQQYHQYKQPKLRNRLVSLNLGLVRREAHRWIRQSDESFDDLMQVGSLGLIRAIERFDLSKGYAFSSFAIPYIRGEIQHYLRDRSATVRIPRKWQSLAHQSRQAIHTLRTELNRQPTEQEIAGFLDISLEEWSEVKLAVRNRSLLSLDAPMLEEDSDSASLSDVLPDPKYRSFQLAEEDRIRLHQALQQLEDKTRSILEFVFLQDLTQKETAERLGISSVTVSRRVKQGLKHLKSLMVSSPEDETAQNVPSAEN